MTSTSASGAMEGRGAYNTHALMQGSASVFGVPYLEAAARKIDLDPTDQPVVIVDYGSSQGKNSLTPVRVAIDALRPRLDADRSILVYHVDLPANDFSTLFTVLEADPDRYLLNRPNVFPCGIGRSFYESVLPEGYVHLGWSSYAALWLSRIPVSIPGHIAPRLTTGEVRAAFERQAAADWESFLGLRGRELRPGGRLVVVFGGVNDHGSSGFEDMWNHGNAVLAKMVDDGDITSDERARMVIGSWSRRREEVLAPFARDRQFRGLIIEHCEMTAVADAAWAVYEQDRNAEALASKHAAFFRSTFGPSLSLALRNAGHAEAYTAFSVRLERLLQKRLSRAPAPVNLCAWAIVLAKTIKPTVS